MNTTSTNARCKRFVRCRLVWLLLAVLATMICPVAGPRSGADRLLRGFDEPKTSPPPSRADIEFFESRIRPVLVEHCYACHSRQAEAAGKLRGGLRVDDRESLRAGGDSGPAVLPGDLDGSLIVAAIRHDGSDYKMPPSGKLPAQVIADFETWIRRGAADPRDASADAKSAALHLNDRRQHWAYQPARQVNVPAIEQHHDQTQADQHWARNAIDAFLIDAARKTDATHSRGATATVFLRRLSFDLRGLPPSPDEMDDYLQQEIPDAGERLIDRWLASPRFGERWGRHWLDVARYAESVTLRGFVLPEAWRYREYVIDAWNSDRPLSDFIREQIAGDLLSAPTLEQAQHQRIATTFLALGNTNLEEQDKQQLVMDVVDEQLDVITKAFLAQTVSCARCHDHKFDPITTRDYYALAGILRNCQTLEHDNVSKWLELPLPVEPALEALLQQQEASLAKNAEQIKAAREALKANGTDQSTMPTEIVALKDLSGIVVDDVHAKRVGEWMHSQHTKPYIGDGYLHDRDEAKGKKTLTFIPELPSAGTYEVRFAYTPGSNRSPAAPVTVFSAEGEKTIHVNQQQRPPIDGRFVSLGRFRFEPTGQSFVLVDNAGTTGHVIADAVQFLPLDDTTSPNSAKASTDTARPEDSPKVLATIEAKQNLEAVIARLEAERKELQRSAVRRPLYMSLRERVDNEDAPIHKRGSVHLLGERVPRGFLPIIGPQQDAPIPADRSGRRELAEWLASSDNPLTPRVFVNRLWHWTFGAGLVRSTDNFGTTGELPTHPDLLEYLAGEFRNGAESPKLTIRKLVTSATYQLSSESSAEMRARDPDNLHWCRMPRRRLDAECIVNALLATSGRMDLSNGGPTILPGTAADYGYQHASSRRAEYWPVLRNSLPDLFEVFDFADPSMVTGARAESVVASQSLALMNQPRMTEWSHHAAQRVLAFADSNSPRTDHAFRLTLGRLPSQTERDAVLRFLDQAAPHNAGSEQTLRAWSQAIQSLYASLDFRYLE